MPRLLILAGTTAVGKTDVSIPLAEFLKGEIVNADSRQIYRELEIGTAKPTAEQLARVRHHFINEKSIRERWTAGDFAREGRRRTEEIIARGKVALVVGGSMLYLRALMDGFYDADVEDESDYVALRKELAERGEEVLYAELQQCDPELAARTAPRDHHRLLRGLSVYRRHGTRLSALQTLPTKPIEQPFRLFFLHADRAQTYDRVNLRAAQMVEDGLVEEVRALMDAGWDESNCNALRTHGYQEVFPYLRGEITREAMIEDIQMAVRHYVKRQLTWFRRDTRAVWIERRFDEPPEEVARRIVREYVMQADV
ncbi:MAG TPA: tRNA (adenosine(37)-N6)-dimethylallyltransferase MiaA [bacterium]|jgi:tRNA dimethylallyltransferase